MARPTPADLEMTFNMGRQGYPAICMSHVAARQYCKWLSETTGEFYRLATEAEWEYACRAGSATPYAVAAEKLGDVAWFAGNSSGLLEDGAPPEEAYRKVGKKQADAFGLFDMHGNVAEWAADYYHADLFTDAQHVGFRIVRPLRAPSAEERARFENP